MRVPSGVRSGIARSIVAVVLLAYVPGCGKSESNGSPVGNSPPMATTFTDLAGTWQGTWTDTRYNVSGPLEAVFAVNGNSVTATGTIGLQSLNLGNETGTGSGTISGQTLAFTFGANTVGSGSGSLSITGAGSGTGTVTGVLNLGAFTYSGTAVAGKISGEFAFTSPTGGRGVATLTKQ
jgi:hypothetical protein